MWEASPPPDVISMAYPRHTVKRSIEAIDIAGLAVPDPIDRKAIMSALPILLVVLDFHSENATVRSLVKRVRHGLALAINRVSGEFCDRTQPNAFCAHPVNDEKADVGHGEARLTVNNLARLKNLRLCC